MNPIECLNFIIDKEMSLSSSSRARYESKDRSALMLAIIVIAKVASKCSHLDRTKIPVSSIEIRPARRESLLKGLIALGLIERSKSNNTWFIEVLDRKLAHQLTMLDWTNKLHSWVRDEALKIFAPQQVKVKGQPLGNKNHERLVLCEWIIRSELKNGYCTDPRLSLSAFAKLLGVQAQTLRKQIKQKSFPFRYYPGSTCKPVGKFGSVFVPRQRSSQQQQFIYESDKLSLSGRHIKEFMRLPPCLRRQMLAYLKGNLQAKSISDFYSSLESEDYISIRGILPLAQLGLDSDRWHLSFPNIASRMLCIVPECWVVHARLTPNAQQVDSKELQLSAHKDKIEALIEIIKARLHFRSTSQSKDNPHSEDEIPYPFLELVAMFVNDLLHEISREAKRLEKWQNDSQVLIDNVIPLSEYMFSDLQVSYLFKR